MATGLLPSSFSAAALPLPPDVLRVGSRGRCSRLLNQPLQGTTQAGVRMPPSTQRDLRASCCCGSAEELHQDSSYTKQSKTPW